MSPGAAHSRSTAPGPAREDLPPGADLPTERGSCALCGERRGTRLASGPDFEYDTTRTELTLWRCPCGGCARSWIPVWWARPRPRMSR